ncbi:hypothetical protein GH893_31590, partial [Bacillus thuringiensis]|nr:hypothetical protein [Bacillus thuringiensis]
EKLGPEPEGPLRTEDFSADGKHLPDTCIYAPPTPHPTPPPPPPPHQPPPNPPP